MCKAYNQIFYVNLQTELLKTLHFYETPHYCYTRMR